MRLRIRPGCALVAAVGAMKAVGAVPSSLSDADATVDSPTTTTTTTSLAPSHAVPDGDRALRNEIGKGMSFLVGGWKDIQAEGFRDGVCWVGEEGVSGGGGGGASAATDTAVTGTSTGSDSTADPSSTKPGREPEPEDEESDSPLDNTRFLSFEEWKKQNLAKAGQSAENVGGGSNRQGGSAANAGRKRPGGVNNALDAFGDEAEIELEFGGFAAERPGGWVRRGGGGEGADVGAGGGGQGEREGEQGGVDVGEGPDGKVVSSDGQDGVPRGGARRKDAGITCPERFNFASFDCAATVLKTNPECMGSSSVLIENKDSYMLNECGAKNKFLILELCDDILVDTIVLANYEFFSSIFRSFKVSVSDRYPAKPDQWKELGMYEARNSREIQAFAVENPLIWARYLRIEFLTHYGSEFYCPVSLIRVHGTTMMEEYKHDGEEVEARAEEDEEASEVENTAVQEEEAVDGNGTFDESEVKENLSVEASDIASPKESQESEANICPVPTRRNEINPLGDEGITCAATEAPSRSQVEVPPSAQPNSNSVSQTTSESTVSKSTTRTVSERASSSTSVSQKRVEKSSSDIQSTSSTTGTASQKAQSETVDGSSSTSSSSTETSSAKDDNSTATEPSKMSTTTTQQPPANPTTQESFFKSVNKRLHMLESNSSLSLLYIEEQSRILRDAFDKMEKRQLTKTTNFLGNLNATVLDELREFRQEYDHIWQSMVMEFEYQRQHHHREIYAVTSQLGILADELVFQKRLSVIQSVFVLVCFVLVLFSRGSVGSYIDIPRVQSMVMSRSQSFRSSSPPFDSPTSTRPASSYRENGGHTRDSSEELKGVSVGPSITYLPPTPTSETGCPFEEDEGEEAGEELEEEKAQTSHSERSSGSFNGRDRSPSLRSLRRESSPSLLRDSDDLDEEGERVTPLLKPSDLPQSPPTKLGGLKSGKRSGFMGNG